MEKQSPPPSEKVPQSRRRRVKQACHAVSLYRACVVAHGSIEAIFDARPKNGVAEIVQLSRKQIELEEGMLSFDAKLFQLVDTMSRQEKVGLLFELCVSQHREELAFEEIDGILQKLRLHSRDYPPAEELIEVFASRQGGGLLKDDFESVIDALAASSKDCSFDDMVQLLLRLTIFAVESSSIVEETVIYVSGNSNCGLEEAIAEARLILLFNALDATQSGLVYLKDVVRSLYRTTESLCIIQRESLLMLRDSMKRRLDYEQFSEIMLNVTDCFPRLSINEIANSVTMSLVRFGDIGELDLADIFITPMEHQSVSSFSSIESYDMYSFDRSYEDGINKTSNWSSAAFTASYAGMIV